MHAIDLIVNDLSMHVYIFSPNKITDFSLVTYAGLQRIELSPRFFSVAYWMYVTIWKKSPVATSITL